MFYDPSGADMRKPEWPVDAKFMESNPFLGAKGPSTNY